MVTRADLLARINNACVRIKDRRHELRRATLSTLQRVRKCIEVVLASLKICYELCHISTVQGFVHCRSSVTQASVKVITRDALLGRILNAADRI